MKKLAIFIFLCLFTLVAYTQPVNDDCTNAISLTPELNNICNSTMGSNVGVVSIDYDACADIQKRTVWYKFTAIDAKQTIKLILGTMQQGIIDVYTNTCEDLSDVSYCNAGETGPVIERQLTGLSIGQEYFIVITVYYIFMNKNIHKKYQQ